MDSGPSTLTDDELARFREDGYVVIKGAFRAEDALAIQSEWWAELREIYGIERDDRRTWRQPRADLKRAKSASISQQLASVRVCGVLDDLLGEGSWQQPRHWGRVLTTFPEPGEWTVPIPQSEGEERRFRASARLWHSDQPTAWHRDALSGVQVFSFIGPVRPGGGGTLILSGAHHLLEAWGASLARRGLQEDAANGQAFYDQHPWLRALTGRALPPADRIRHFMEVGATIDGVPIRVVELTGDPGDMVFCHPAMAHCAAPNCSDFPRFMRIVHVMTRGFRSGGMGRD